MIYALIFISKVVFLAFACTNTMANTRATIPVTAIGIFAIVVMGALSYLEHCRSYRPSSLLTLYLLAATPMNAARCRTLWNMPSSTGVLTAFIVVTSLMGIALALELAPKDSLVRENIRKPSPEEKRGIVERSLLAWIVPTFVYGYKHTFTPKTLPPVDPRLTTCKLDRTVVNGTLLSIWKGQCIRKLTRHRRS
jgi:ATP-binding cassette subfamily C (CFTR/MRP) protein 1